MAHEIQATIRGTYCDYSARFTCDVKLVCETLIVTAVDLVELDRIDATSGQCTIIPICPENGTQRERNHFREVAQFVLENDRAQFEQVTQQIEQAAYEQAQLDRNELAKAG